MVTANVPTPTKEMRAGLVLYGGVSLAVYIYGVVYEFLRAVRGARGLEPNAYTTVFGKSRTSFVVDIISGTSAGGINGVFLAKAICNGLSTRSFERIRSLWMNDADFSVLLKPGRKEMAALLNEKLFEERLRQGLSDMDTDVVRAGKGNELSPAASALDLFVISTDLNGYLLSGQELGDTIFWQPIEAREYRRVHHLKFRTRYKTDDPERGYYQNDFSSDKNEALLNICRATSAYPVALRPVKILRSSSVGKIMFGESGSDEYGNDGYTYLMDGGVLDNKPFTETIATIFKRAPLNKDVDRILFFVEPDPETFYAGAEKEPPEPGFWEIVMKATMGIPSHESIARDFQEIRDRNARIRQFTDIFDTMEKFINKAWKDNEELFNEAKGQEYRDFLERQPVFQGYQALKLSRLLIRLRDVCLARAFKDEKHDKETVDKINIAFKNAFDAVCKEEKGKEKILDVFDIPYRIRKYFRMYEMLKTLNEEKKLNEGERETIGGLVNELWECLDDADNIEWNTWNSDVGQPEAWFAGRLSALKENVKNYDQPSLERELKALLDAMLLPTDGFHGIPAELDALSDHGLKLAKKIDDTVKKLELPENPLKDFPPFQQIFKSFELRDMYIYPMEFISDLGERDKIDIVRISPRDATFISSDVAGKLAGETLAHFGGFVKREWRKNDIMWGRLDAAELIVRTLAVKNGYQAGETDELAGEVLLEIMRDELKGRPGIRGDSLDDFMRYLREDYHVGGESLKNVDPETSFPILLNVMKSLRDMFKYDRKRREGGGSLMDKLFGYIDRWLARILNVLSLPAGLLIDALFEKAPLTRKISRYTVVILGLWGTITFAIFIIGRVINIDWLDIGWPLAGIAAAAVLLASLFAVLSKVVKPASNDKSKSGEVSRAP
jgi:patatin-related protein